MKQCILVFFCLCSISVFAQRQYVWDSHEFGFSTPKDLSVVENTWEQFTAISMDRALAVSINPWDDPSVTEENLEDAVIAMAVELEVFGGGKAEVSYAELPNLVLYYMMAAPNDPENFEYMIVALLLDPNSGTNLVATIGFDDGNEDDAIKLMLSFYKK